jgi:class 3 adenylate cyclase/tetratricopeptide (TPR) repeat protein
MPWGSFGAFRSFLQLMLVERKLATVLFVDLVDSTGLVANSDPEVVRRRVTRFFEQVSRCVETHGGIVEKFAGDAVMAAFGVPRAHEDDAERAVRAGLAMLNEVHGLGLEARIGIEAGEVVADESDSTFATGEAVNLAARLQQAAGPGEILIGPGAIGLAGGSLEVEDVGPVEVRGREAPLWTWRVVGASADGAVRPNAAPFVGRDAELALLENTWSRALRDRRAHLFTVYGEPGLGKSRLTAEFTSGLEGATILKGRALPYGEGITYWPLAEMVKAAAGISDDDPVSEAVEKLRACCEDEAVADLLGLASGVLAALEGDRSQQEIAWAAREFVEQLAEVQPLVMVFEDIHWAEEPLLELIEHLAAWVRDSSLLLLCLARPELLDIRPGWGGGRVRATAIELGPLSVDESEELVGALLEDGELRPDVRMAVFEKTEGNPLFLEETVRAIGECGGEIVERIPDTLHALIAARIDRLPSEEKMLLQRAAVIGRTFWGGALDRLASDVLDGNCEELIDDLLLRDFILREPRSSISGERAYRFKHVLIREVAYAGLSKSTRAEQHRLFAEWLRERAGEELVEIRAYHLDQASTLVAELDGAPPPELASEAAAALEEAGKRALAREANRSARSLLVRSVELEPTLERQFKAARAAWRLSDLPAVSVEMELVRKAAEEAGESRIHSRALTALAEVTLMRDADMPRARDLAERALEMLGDTPGEARYEALSALGTIAWWVGDLREAERLARESLEVARQIGRKDLEGGAADGLSHIYAERLEHDKARPLVERANELADESGSVIHRAWARRGRANLHLLVGELDEAEAALTEAKELFDEAGGKTHKARTMMVMAEVAVRRGDDVRAERLLRDAIMMLKPLGDRATLCEVQRRLAQILVRDGKLDEAERVALEARETVGPQDHGSRATTRMALGLVRAAQGRDEEAEALLRDAVGVLDGTDFLLSAVEPLEELVQFLRERGRDDEAGPFARRLLELAPAAGLASSFETSAAQMA